MPVSSWRRSGRASSSEMQGSGTRSAGSDGAPEQVDGAPNPTSDAMQLSPEEPWVKSRGVVDDVRPEGEWVRTSPMVMKTRARAWRAEEMTPLHESKSQLVQAAEREVAKRTGELVETLRRAQRTTDEAQKARLAVVAAEDQACTAAEHAEALRARLEEERLLADEEAEQLRRSEAAALERRAREFDEAEVARKQRRRESLRDKVSAAAEARNEAQRLASERAAEARQAADRAEAVARALEAAVGEVVTASQAEETEAIAEAEATARADTEAAAAERDIEDEQTATRIEAFKQAERERQQQREREAERALVESAEHVAASEAGVRHLRDELVGLEQQQAEIASEVVARNASVAEAERLADAARNAEARSREARQAEETARQAARTADSRAAAARAEVERATAQAEEAARQAAELIRQADQLSAEARVAEQLAAASARELDLRGSSVLAEPEARDRDDIRPSSSDHFLDVEHLDLTREEEKDGFAKDEELKTGEPS